MKNCVKTILTSFLYKLGIGKKIPVKPLEESKNTDRETASIETQIIANASAAFIHHNDNIALVVDHEFKDVPSWIEWDNDSRKLTIVQMGGGMMELETPIDEEKMKAYKEQKRLYLVANYAGQQIIHHLAFIIRN